MPRWSTRSARPPRPRSRLSSTPAWSPPGPRPMRSALSVRTRASPPTSAVPARGGEPVSPGPSTPPSQPAPAGDDRTSGRAPVVTTGTSARRPGSGAAVVPPAGVHGGDGAAVAAALGVAAHEVLDLSASLNPVAPDPRPVVARHLDSLTRYPDPGRATAAL